MLATFKKERHCFSPAFFPILFFWRAHTSLALLYRIMHGFSLIMSVVAACTGHIVYSITGHNGLSCDTMASTTLDENANQTAIKFPLI